MELSNKSYLYLRTTPSSSPFHRGRVDYQAVSPPVEGGVRGGSRLNMDLLDSPISF